MPTPEIFILLALVAFGFLGYKIARAARSKKTRGAGGGKPGNWLDK